MGGLTPEALLVIAALAAGLYVGEATVTGIKKLGHGVKTVANCIVHPMACGDDPPAPSVTRGGRKGM